MAAATRLLTMLFAASLSAASLAAASLAALPASAQDFSGPYDRDLASAGKPEARAFLRIPLGGRSDDVPSFGFGLYAGCTASLNAVSTVGRDARAAPFRSVEIGRRFDADWTLSLGGATQRNTLGSWSAQTGEFSFTGEGKSSSTWLWIGLGVVAGVAVAATLVQDDDDPLLCPNNTIPNPIAGTCEPLQLN